MWAMPTPILAFVYWLHLTATVVWLGGLIALSLIVRPGLMHQPDNTDHGVLLDAIERRFWPLANVSLAVLIVTGTVQMGGDPHYKGFLKIDTPWTIGLFAKHIVIVAIVAASAAMQWMVQPALSRASLLARRGDAPSIDQENRLRQRVRQLTLVNLGLGILVLMFTAYITAL
jgi:uncharacterized membrane protein